MNSWMGGHGAADRGSRESVLGALRAIGEIVISRGQLHLPLRAFCAEVPDRAHVQFPSDTSAVCTELWWPRWIGLRRSTVMSGQPLLA